MFPQLKVFFKIFCFKLRKMTNGFISLISEEVAIWSPN
uniref:Uncharacterized protein n=1 Tax=Rhizophora mucronata TaxID=61149 RepID=A0A2P2NK78_RHIMU